MTRDLRRAVAYLLVGSLAFLAPALEGRAGTTAAAAATAAAFGAVAVVGFKTSAGPVFELFARRRDRTEERLYGLASFCLAVAALGVLLVAVDLPAIVPAVAALVLTAGNVGQRLAVSRVSSPAVGASAFAAFGTVGGSLAAVAAGWLGADAVSLSLVVFVAASGALLGGLIRSVLYVQDDSLVVLAVALVVWFLLSLGLSPSPERVAVGLAVTVGLGYVAYALGTASVTGMLTGVLLALFAVVLGGYGWFVLLVTFFGLGGLASKYRYEEKLNRGIAQENEGARGGGNVLANSAVALVAVVGYAASGHAGVDAAVFEFAFAGAVAAALADTFSSEFGGLFDAPRLITTLERVDPGTDGGVTWQGAVAGAAGSGIIAGLAWAFFGFDAVATATILGAGVLGMVVDSILGATLEGGRLGNQSVNLLATLSAGVSAAVVALLV